MVGMRMQAGYKGRVREYGHILITIGERRWCLEHVVVRKQQRIKTVTSLL